MITKKQDIANAIQNCAIPSLREMATDIANQLLLKSYNVYAILVRWSKENCSKQNRVGQFKNAYDLLFNEAVDIIEEKARKILADHDNLDEFIMGMGGCFFTTKQDADPLREVFNIDPCERAYMKSLSDFLDYAKRFKVTGHPMRFTATGTKRTMW